MSDNRTTVRTRIRIARGSKEALEQTRDSLDSGELFWQKSDDPHVNDDSETIGTNDTSSDETQ